MKHETRTSMGPLEDGQTVAIIGGGPSGAACAIALKNLAAGTGKTINVVLYEGKVFSGETHYNQCLGVLSPPIEKIVTDELGLPFPHHLVRSKITGYILHSDQQQIELTGEDEPSYALRRVQFDAYLLDQARLRGVRVVHSRVTDVELRWDKVVVYSDSEECRADVVVGAFGLDDGGCKLFERATAHLGGNSYRQPQALGSIVTKIHPRDEYLARFGECIHAFLPSIPQIEFGAITPKGNHLTINIAGGEISSLWMDRFLELPAVKEVLPKGKDLLPPHSDLNANDLRYFKGRFPISVAKNYYGNRYVIVGDAAWLLRSFKGKGVNSGCMSGAAAAKAMMKEGISKEAFQTFFTADPRTQAVFSDLPYGRIIRRLAVMSANYGFLDGVIVLARKEPLLRRALFNCVSAHKLYREIVWETLQPKLTLKMAGAVGLSLLGIYPLQPKGSNMQRALH
ncbi:MAG: NAD(P)/FAD-dependent oxidoreductase [Anaerolineae bacterium]